MNILSKLQSVFPADQMSAKPEDLAKYGKDWTTYYDIKPSAVVFPTSAEQIQKLVLTCRQQRIGLVPSGGRTGLSGGACATKGEVIVSMERMNQVVSFDATDSTVTVQAGMITEALQEFAKSKGLFYPVDFAARGSSQIGGNIATNAGGIKVVRYGSTRDWVVGLKVVTGQGDIFELNRGLTKNATGYDLRHLFIGSEGTLGFIVEATLKLAKPPPPAKVLVLGAPTLPAIMEIFAAFKKSTTLTAFEMFSDKALKHVLKKTGLTNPLEIASAYYVLVEIEAGHDTQEAACMSCLEGLIEKKLVTDGAISQTAAQSKHFWRLREDISESLSSFSPYKNDVSVRIGKVPALIKDLDAVFAKSYPNWEVIWFGHIGDGNLHINILRPEGMSKEEFLKHCQNVDMYVFQAVQVHGGSISAEHGVGLVKKPFLSYSRPPTEIAMLKAIKTVFDPEGIINPGKMV